MDLNLPSDLLDSVLLMAVLFEEVLGAVGLVNVVDGIKEDLSLVLCPSLSEPDFPIVMGMDCDRGGFVLEEALPLRKSALEFV